MSDEFSDTPGTKLADGVADAINKLLQNLVIKCSKPEIRDYFEVGVIGYGASVGPAFSGTLSGRDLVPISEVANQPSRIEKRQRKESDSAGGILTLDEDFAVWFDAVAMGGTPMCEALKHAHDILAEWIKKHPESYPPIVINITDGEATDGNPVGPTQELMNLSTNDGNVLVYNCHISAKPEKPITFADTDRGLPDEFAQMLFEMSSVIPDSIRQEAQKAGLQTGEHARGFVFNSGLVELVTMLDVGTRIPTAQLR